MLSQPASANFRTTGSSFLAQPAAPTVISNSAVIMIKTVKSFCLDFIK